jgi:hypothetical protein
MMVKVPGRPEAIRVSTATEVADAQQYANTVGGTVVPLPLPLPDGYTVGPDGHHVPQPSATCAGMAHLPDPIDNGPHRSAPTVPRPVATRVRPPTTLGRAARRMGRLGRHRRRHDLPTTQAPRPLHKLR